MKLLCKLLGHGWVSDYVSDKSRDVWGFYVVKKCSRCGEIKTRTAEELKHDNEWKPFWDDETNRK